MALLTLERSSNSCNCPKIQTDTAKAQQPNDKDDSSRTNKSLSECYFAGRATATLVSTTGSGHERPRPRRRPSAPGSDIQQHLQSMFYLLRPEETLKMAVKLESGHPYRTRYLVVVSRVGDRSTEESCLLGIDCNDKTTIGLVLRVLADTTITLDGDGGFSVSVCGRHHIFKPVSVQAMWSALQTLHKISSKAREQNYFEGGPSHEWVNYYDKKIESDRSCLNEWHAMDNLESRRPPSPNSIRTKPTEREEAEMIIRSTLKEIMMSVDLDEVTSKCIRNRLEEDLNMNLNEFKSFIDQEIITILGQMDAPTEIFDHVYLGSEWNASNFEELQKNGVGHILNVTREIDNFFPGMFDYLNIRVLDDEKTDLLKHWDNTFKYITKAKNKGSKVLVHCKMGVSRSASVVIAYAMKAYNWDFKKALTHVKDKRNCIKPNKSFITQLETYQGILDAMKNKDKLQRSKSETNLKNQEIKHTEKKGVSEVLESGRNFRRESKNTISIKHVSVRSKSWSPDFRINVTELENSPIPIFLSLENLNQPHQKRRKNLTTFIENARNVLMPLNNGQSYSVSPNQIVHIPGSVKKITEIKGKVLNLTSHFETEKTQTSNNELKVSTAQLNFQKTWDPGEKSQENIIWTSSAILKQQGQLDSDTITLKTDPLLENSNQKSPKGKCNTGLSNPVFENLNLTSHFGGRKLFGIEIENTCSRNKIEGENVKSETLAANESFGTKSEVFGTKNEVFGTKIENLCTRNENLGLKNENFGSKEAFVTKINAFGEKNENLGLKSENFGPKNANFSKIEALGTKNEIFGAKNEVFGSKNESFTKNEAFSTKNEAFGTKNEVFGPKNENFTKNEALGTKNEAFGTKNEAFGTKNEVFGPKNENFTKNEAFGTKNEAFGTKNEVFGPKNENFTKNEAFGTKNEAFGTKNEAFGTKNEAFSTKNELFGPKNENFTKNATFNPKNEIFVSKNENFTKNEVLGTKNDTFGPKNEAFNSKPESFSPKPDSLGIIKSLKDSPNTLDLEKIAPIFGTVKRESPILRRNNNNNGNSNSNENETETKTETATSDKKRTDKSNSKSPILRRIADPNPKNTSNPQEISKIIIRKDPSDPFSNRLDKVFDREERKSEDEQQQRKCPSRQSSWSSYDSAVVLGYNGENREVSRHSSWGSGDTRTLPSRNSSWGSYDMRRSHVGQVITEKEDRADILSTSSSGIFPYDKDEIPWFPGTVKRTKQKLEGSEGKKCVKNQDNSSSTLSIETLPDLSPKTRSKIIHYQSSPALCSKKSDKIDISEDSRLSVSAPGSSNLCVITTDFPLETQNSKSDCSKYGLVKNLKKEFESKTNQFDDKEKNIPQSPKITTEYENDDISVKELVGKYEIIETSPIMRQKCIFNNKPNRHSCIEVLSSKNQSQSPPIAGDSNEKSKNFDTQRPKSAFFPLNTQNLNNQNSVSGSSIQNIGVIAPINQNSVNGTRGVTTSLSQNSVVTAPLGQISGNGPLNQNSGPLNQNKGVTASLSQNNGVMATLSQNSVVTSPLSQNSGNGPLNQNRGVTTSLSQNSVAIAPLSQNSGTGPLNQNSVSLNQNSGVTVSLSQNSAATAPLSQNSGNGSLNQNSGVTVSLSQNSVATAPLSQNSGNGPLNQNSSPLNQNSGVMAPLSQNRVVTFPLSQNSGNVALNQNIGVNIPLDQNVGVISPLNPNSGVNIPLNQSSGSSSPNADVNSPLNQNVGVNPPFSQNADVNIPLSKNASFNTPFNTDVGVNHPLNQNAGLKFPLSQSGTPLNPNAGVNPSLSQNAVGNSPLNQDAGVKFPLNQLGATLNPDAGVNPPLCQNACMNPPLTSDSQLNQILPLSQNKFSLPNKNGPKNNSPVSPKNNLKLPLSSNGQLNLISPRLKPINLNLPLKNNCPNNSTKNKLVLSPSHQNQESINLFLNTVSTSPTSKNVNLNLSPTLNPNNDVKLSLSPKRTLSPSSPTKNFESLGNDGSEKFINLTLNSKISPTKNVSNNKISSPTKNQNSGLNKELNFLKPNQPISSFVKSSVVKAAAKKQQLKNRDFSNLNNVKLKNNSHNTM